MKTQPRLRLFVCVPNMFVQLGGASPLFNLVEVKD
jgi:hypothetical protein